MSNSWVTGKQAVNFFSTWCAARSWVFQPVDASNDFGKDGYVDITDDGRLTGELFSVQVKGGESWTTAGGYSIPVGKHRDVWMYSMVPVIGVVHDPKDGRLRWANLTAALREDRELASVHVPAGALLDEDEQLQVLLESVRATTRPGLPLALGSDSDDEQEAAVWDCFAIARRDADALVALRRCFRPRTRSRCRQPARVHVPRPGRSLGGPPTGTVCGAQSLSAAPPGP